MNDNIPIGSDTSDAPWNQYSNDPIKIKVTVSMTISKIVEVEVTDYDTYIDEDNLCNDFSDCDLYNAVRSQVWLPNEVHKALSKVVESSGDKEAIKRLNDLKDWEVDDFEVVSEE